MNLLSRWTGVSLHRRFPWQRSAGARAAPPPDAVHVSGVFVWQPADTSPGGWDQNPLTAICQPRWVRESLWSGRSAKHNWPIFHAGHHNCLGGPLLIRATCGAGACQKNGFDRSGAIYKKDNSWVVCGGNNLAWAACAADEYVLLGVVFGWSTKGLTDYRHKTNKTKKATIKKRNEAGQKVGLAVLGLSVTSCVLLSR